MKRALNYIGINCKKSLFSVSFWVAVLVYVLVLIYATTDYYTDSEGVYYLLHYAILNGTSYFLLTVCGVPAAAVFANEWCAERFVYSYTRTGKKWYAAAIITSSFCIAFLVAFIGTALYILFYSFRNPLAITETFSNWDAYANGGLLKSGHTFAYYFTAVLNQSFFAGLFSALASVVSILITNSYIAITMPMVLYLITTNIMSAFGTPQIINPYYIFRGQSYVIKIIQPDLEQNFSVISMLYPYLYSLVMLAIFVVISHFLIKRKYEKNSGIR